MTLFKSDAVRNAQLDALETAIGVSPLFRIYSGTVPADETATETGTLLAECVLPSDWMAAASGGVKTLLGSWTDSSANATGTATHARVYNAAGTVCHLQGTAGLSGTDIILDSVNFTAGQAFTQNSFTLTAGG